MKILIKPSGVTSNEFIALLKKDGTLAKKACYCGRLDPMARGQMLVLEGEECRKMPMYLKGDKTYEFFLVPGFSTDTDDILGLFTDTPDCQTDIPKTFYTQIDSCLKKLQETLKMQKFHKYSSYELVKNGVRHPLWKWEKLGQLEDSDIPEKPIQIHELEILDMPTVCLKTLMETFKQEIEKINPRHDFRQLEISKMWSNQLKILQTIKTANPDDTDNTDNIKKIKLVKCRLTVSTGFYVRQFVYELKKKMKFPMLVYDIHRVDMCKEHEIVEDTDGAIKKKMRK